MTSPFRGTSRFRRVSRDNQISLPPGHAGVSGRQPDVRSISAMKPMKSPAALRAVLLDWDGTLLDSFEADAQAYTHMFGALGFRWGIEELRQHYSPDWHHVYRAAKLPRKKWVEADGLWMRFYRRHQPTLQPGARRVLQALHRRYTLALVSSGNRTRVRRQLRGHTVTPMFRAIVCCEDAPRRKPHPAPLITALARLRLSPAVCVYVGDAPQDIEMAHRAGMRAIGVLEGSPVPERLRAASPDAIISSIRELPGLLKGF
jgi:HAD superfamily hydrolase (TIGR01509 family)